MEAKSLGNTDINGTRQNVKDVVVFGDGDMFKLLCKASSEAQGWMKSTKACEVAHGCVVQVTTQQKNPDGSYAVAEALTYVPGVRIEETVEELPHTHSEQVERRVVSRKLVPIARQLHETLQSSSNRNHY